MTLTPLSVFSIIIFIYMLDWSAGRDVAWFAWWAIVAAHVVGWVLG